jgi:hypothetical protein
MWSTGNLWDSRYTTILGHVPNYFTSIIFMDRSNEPAWSL